MKSCLIVYYSRTGVTDRAAHDLATACGADLETLQSLRPCRNADGFLRAVWHAVRRIPASIAATQRHPSDYPFIVLGTPVWAGHISAPKRGGTLPGRIEEGSTGSHGQTGLGGNTASVFFPAMSL